MLIAMRHEVWVGPAPGLGLIEIRTSGGLKLRSSRGNLFLFLSAHAAALRSSGDFTLNLSMRTMSPISMTKSARDHAGLHCCEWQTAWPRMFGWKIGVCQVTSGGSLG